MIEELIFSCLTGHPNLSSLIGTRVYPLVLPQKPQMPAVTHQKVSSIQAQSLDGPSGLYSTRYQFSSFSTSFEQSKEVIKQVKMALIGLDIQGVYFDNETDEYEEDTKLYHATVDATLWYQEDDLNNAEAGLTWDQLDNLEILFPV